MYKLFILSFFLVTTALGQTGTLKGTIYDDFGEPLLATDIHVVGTEYRATTDLDGKYQLKLPSGTYSVLYQAPFFADQTVTDVVIKNGESTTLDVVMNDGSEVIDGGVVITAKQIKNTEAAMDAARNKSSNVTDGISSETFKKTGDQNAAAAVKRVPGVSVQGGKYVFVRGLGDRYTKTILNGLDIPGLDPDRNAIQMDIFPTNIIKNIIVYKTFSPNLSGDFTGGLVNIETQDFPDDPSFNVSIGGRFRPGMHFNSNYLGYEGSPTDILGFDNGTRKLPINELRPIPDPVLADPLLTTLTSSFSPTMSAKRMTSGMDSKITVSGGNSFKSKNDKITFGFNGAISHKNQYVYYKKAVFSQYTKDPDTGVKKLFEQERRSGAIGQHNVLWSALLSGGIKFEKSKYNITLLRSQNGQSQASDRSRNNFDQTGATLLEDILTYTERALTNVTVQANYNFEKIKFDVNNSLTFSSIDDPDFRTTAFSTTSGDTTLQLGDGAGVSRFFRFLNERNNNTTLNFTVPFQMAERTGKVKFGASALSKTRDFGVNAYQFRVENRFSFSSNPDDLFKPGAIWDPNTRTGTYVIGNREPVNFYEASQNVLAGYGLVELPVVDRLRVIVGARAEQNQMFYTGQNNSGSKIYNNEKTLDKFNILPSANIIYALVKDTMNLRFSFNQTLARPSFKEKSIAQIFDPITSRTFIGNIDLEQTNILNFDLRWEWFFKRGQIVSVSAFFKTFDGHIELVPFETAPDNLKPRNSGESRVFGVELEARKGLDFISDTNNRFSIGTNITFVQSQMDMNTVIISNANSKKTEFESRKENARDGEKIDRFRPMTGQSPFIINANFNYRNVAWKLNANLSYNVQGPALAVVGLGIVPDVYTQPFHSLNLKVSKELSDVVSLSAKVTNILGDKREQLYTSFGDETGTFSLLDPGRIISLTASFNLANLKKSKETE